MSLSDFSSVDLIVRLPGSTAKAALVAVDDGRISEPTEREAALGRKLAAYLAFARSDRFATENPGLVGHELSVEVVCSTPPTDSMRAIGAVQAADVNFSLPVNVSGEAEFRERWGLATAPSA